MLGKDFFVFWQIGKAILSGSALYSSPESLYPPATMLFFTPLGLLPFTIAFALWSGINIILYYLSVRFFSKEKPLFWFLYSPAVFILLTGQIDIIFLWFSTLLTSQQTWKKVLAAVILTLKPQIAFIVLPWHLVRWIKNQPHLLFYWITGSALLHSLPLLIDVNIYSKWIASTQDYSQNRLLLSPGVFALTNFSVPVWVLAILAIIIVIVGLLKTQTISKTMQILALPMGIWYEDIFLLGSISWKWMLPISWLAFILAYMLKTSFVFILIPVFVLVWQIIKETKSSNEEPLAEI